MAAGLPSDVPGMNRHVRRASFTAASSRRSKPLVLSTFASLTLPSAATYSDSTTVPVSSRRRDVGGYSGCAFGRRGLARGRVTAAGGGGAGAALGGALVRAVVLFVSAGASTANSGVGTNTGGGLSNFGGGGGGSSLSSCASWMILVSMGP